jgi:hypothetical protein
MWHELRTFLKEKQASDEEYHSKVSAIKDYLSSLEKPSPGNAPFIVFPTEALSLGIAFTNELEETTELETENEDSSTPKIPPLLRGDIVRRLVRWLGPYVPDFSRQTQAIEERDVPNDVEWTWSGKKSRQGAGIAPSSPHRLFVSDEKGDLSRWTFDYTRRNVLKQIVDFLECLVPDHYSIDIPPEDPAVLVRAWHDRLTAKRIGPRPNKPLYDPIRPIVNVFLVKYLVKASNQEDAFELGTKFGRIFQKLEEFPVVQKPEDDDWFLEEGPDRPLNYQEVIDDWKRWQEYLPHFREQSRESGVEGETYRSAMYDCFCDNFPYQLYQMDLRDLIRQICDAPPLRVSNHSPTRLEARAEIVFEPALHPEMEFSDDDLRFAVDVYNEQIYELHTAAWMALGEVIHVLREDDEIFQRQDEDAPIPRAFTDWMRAPLGRIENDLLKCHLELQESPGPDPHDTIKDLTPGIEALARRVWGNLIGKREEGKSSLHRVLKDKIQSEDLLEKRFAATALGLQDGIRHSIQHRLEDFNATYEDARFLVSAMQYLVKLMRQMQSS